MKYIIAAILSGALFLGLHSPAITINSWDKVLYNREKPKEKRKREFKIITIIWAILTVAMFVYVAFFVDRID